MVPGIHRLVVPSSFNNILLSVTILMQFLCYTVLEPKCSFCLFCFYIIYNFVDLIVLTLPEN